MGGRGSMSQVQQIQHMLWQNVQTEVYVIGKKEVVPASQDLPEKHVSV
jgi:hypothetical protein